jgi:serine/threonine-protein kinase
VPSVIGQTEANAKSALEEANLKANVEYSSDTSKDNGVVVAQSVSAGKQVEQGSSVTITVNKYEETKNATITVNVKSLTGGYKTDDTTLKETDKKKKITVKVGDDKVYDKDVDINTTNVSVPISGKGTVTVKIYIDDVLKSSKDINLTTTSSYTFE